jgi:nitrate/nitrite transporter NarK
MTNINAFFPEKQKGSALGINAGGGNLGVAVVQLIGLLIIATAGTGAPRILLGIYVPLIVVAVVCSALSMDNLSGWDRTEALLWARRISGAVIGIAGAIGAFGGLLINLAVRSSFQSAGSGTPAFWSFVAFYAVCFVVTYAVYMRARTAATDPKTGSRLSYAQV